MAHDLLLTVVKDSVKVCCNRSETAVDLGHSLFPPIVDQKVVYQVGKIIAGGAVNRPFLRQMFVMSENLFHYQVNRDCRCFGVFRLQFGEQSMIIFRRSKEPVRMIDPQAVDHALPDQIENQSMGGVENLFSLYGKGREIIDVEKSAVIDFVGCDPPIG